MAASRRAEDTHSLGPGALRAMRMGIPWRGPARGVFPAQTPYGTARWALLACWALCCTIYGPGVVRWFPQVRPPLFLFGRRTERGLKRCNCEVDFTVECEAAQTFAKNFGHFDNIKIPEIHSELTTQRVMTMEYVPGIKISDWDARPRPATDSTLTSRQAGERASSSDSSRGRNSASNAQRELSILLGI